MRAIWTIGIPFLVLPIAFACSAAEGQAAPAVAGGPAGPLVVELFTSQGCSSCPPADRVLSKLATNKDIAPLSFHVDYWDDLGWADPYASPAWTDRQRQYAKALGDERVYTPELVIGGSKGFVGSHVGPITVAIQQASRPALLSATATWAKDSVTITATAPANADVLVAVWEDSLKKKVTRGENSGETLANDRVVRRLERVATAGTQGTITVKLDPAWRTLGAVAFAQRTDKRITASASLPR